VRIQLFGFGISLNPSLRISLILAFLEFAAEGAERPREITPDHYERTAYLVEDYILPMARCAFAGASVTEVERSALRPVALVRKSKVCSSYPARFFEVNTGNINDSQCSTALRLGLMIGHHARCRFAVVKQY
jgi:hypothetical protein